MADDFFNNNQEETAVETPETIKLGDKEYTQEELSQKVGLAEKYTELETKYNTKLDKVVPDWSRASQEAAELRKFKEQVEAEREMKAKTEETGLTPEQMEAAKKQLYDLMGGKPMTQTEFDQMYYQRRGAEKLLDDAEAVVNQMKEQGNPATTVEELFKHMDETGIRNPQKAYKDMFEADLDRIKEQKLASIRPTGFQTVSGTGAAAKEPKGVKVTRDNLGNLLSEVLSRPKG